MQDSGRQYGYQEISYGSWERLGTLNLSRIFFFFMYFIIVTRITGSGISLIQA